MQIDDLTIEVRDKSLKRMGQIMPTDGVSAKLSPVLNGVGSWQLTLPASHPLAPVLSTPGAGIIVTGPTDVILSGPVDGIASVVSKDSPGGLTTFTGITDDYVLSDTLCFPDPTNGDATTQAKSNDIRTGDAESVMQGFVGANCGPTAVGVRNRAQLTLATNQHRGPAITKSARFDVLGDLLNEIATVSNLGFRVVQRGSVRVFEVLDRRDVSPFVRFDVLNGNLASQEVDIAPPGATVVIVAGQGDGTDRQFVTRTTALAQDDSATWGRYIEVWQDQRNTDVVDELNQAGDEVLNAEGFTQVATKAIPTDSTTMQLGKDWRLGDYVTIVVEGVEQGSFISGYNIVVSSAGVAIGVVLGDMGQFDQQVAQQTISDNLEQRVEALEKNTGTYQGTPWQTPVLSAGWVNLGGTNQTLRFRRVGNGLVEVQGVIKSTGGGALTAFKLDVGFRPDADILVTCVCGTSVSYATVSAADGSVTPFGTTTSQVAFQFTFGITEP